MKKTIKNMSGCDYVKCVEQSLFIVHCWSVTGWQQMTVTAVVFANCCIQRWKLSAGQSDRWATGTFMLVSIQQLHNDDNNLYYD